MAGNKSILHSFVFHDLFLANREVGFQDFPCQAEQQEWGSLPEQDCTEALEAEKGLLRWVSAGCRAALRTGLLLGQGC